MEVDLSKNSALFYCAPNILKDTRDISIIKIKIAIQTKGYKNYEGNNLVISIGTLGKMSTSSSMKYKVNIDKIIKVIASKGIKMIEPQKINPNELAGL